MTSKGFSRLTATAAVMPAANVDTDVIMPKQFLKGIDRAGLARGLFHDLRFDSEGQPDPAFLLNRPGFEDCRILVVGPNFGCGSSREHAVWGMLQYGIRAIVGTSFAGIFADNAANNGLLLISLDEEAHARLAAHLAARHTALTIDLEAETIMVDDLVLPFAIDPRRRRAIMLGLDRIGGTLAHADAIRAFQTDYLAAAPWLA
ncbi:3-isopropylmalate dehydratase small subunit [Sphingomonas oryzagri]|uniref:3-isopropylmalate dehydratase small subunit n=1 Tax=Sphingomonas oryzagri TaxID=3042314 RepID=A0ABT6MX53_9SPHN|nr:3-isopropylmalate dehydratase small subunit [Sphingomonas oryzagri]MDH7637628.1 3-isopropylmalate dehydratase small subunit [Sphingomonas oryzagri]